MEREADKGQLWLKLAVSLLGLVVTAGAISLFATGRQLCLRAATDADCNLLTGHRLHLSGSVTDAAGADVSAAYKLDRFWLAPTGLCLGLLVVAFLATGVLPLLPLRRAWRGCQLALAVAQTVAGSLAAVFGFVLAFSALTYHRISVTVTSFAMASALLLVGAFLGSLHASHLLLRLLRCTAATAATISSSSPALSDASHTEHTRSPSTISPPVIPLRSTRSCPF